jgi:hypothetical protein
MMLDYGKRFKEHMNQYKVKIYMNSISQTQMNSYERIYNENQMKELKSQIYSPNFYIHLPETETTYEIFLFKSCISGIQFAKIKEN